METHPLTIGTAVIHAINSALDLF